MCVNASAPHVSSRPERMCRRYAAQARLQRRSGATGAPLPRRCRDARTLLGRRAGNAAMRIGTRVKVERTWTEAHEAKSACNAKLTWQGPLHFSPSLQHQLTRRDEPPSDMRSLQPRNPWPGRQLRSGFAVGALVMTDAGSRSHAEQRASAASTPKASVTNATRKMPPGWASHDAWRSKSVDFKASSQSSARATTMGGTGSRIDRGVPTDLDRTQLDAKVEPALNSGALHFSGVVHDGGFRPVRKPQENDGATRATCHGDDRQELVDTIRCRRPRRHAGAGLGLLRCRPWGGPPSSAMWARTGFGITAM